MDASKSVESAAKKLGDDNKAYYEVPPNLIQFKEKQHGRRVLIIKNSTSTHYRKYKPGDNDSTYYCWACYLEHGLHVFATCTNGIIKAPRLHSCEWIPLDMKEKIKRIKLETNDVSNPCPSSSAMPSTSKPIVIASKNPCQNISSNPVVDDLPDRPLSRESDIIFLDDDEIKHDYKDSANSPAKIQAIKDRSQYRSVTPAEYKKAYSSGGVMGNRLLVFEENDKTHVRQYAGNQNDYWYCLGCFRSERKHTQAFTEENGVYMVPKEHICEAITYAKAKEEQQKIIEKLGIYENEEDDGSGDGDDNEEDKSDKDSDSDNDKEKRPATQLRISPIRSRLRTRSNTPSVTVYSPSPTVKAKPRRGRPRKAPPTPSQKRAFKADEYLRGVGAQHQTNGRIHVFVEDDKSLCHEYRKSKDNSYYCRGCYVLDKSKKRWASISRNKNLSVPLLGDHCCKPFKYADIQKEQDEIKKRYGTKRTATSKQSTTPGESSTASSVVSSATIPPYIPPPKSTPIYSGARLRTRTRTPTDMPSSSPSPSTTVSTPPKTPIHQRERTPFPSAVLERRRKRRAERMIANSAVKKAKPTEGESESRNSSAEKHERNVTRILQQPRIVKDRSFKRTDLQPLNKDKNGSLGLDNSSTSSSSAASTPVNHQPISRSNVLFTSKSSSDFIPKTPALIASILKPSNTTSSTTNSSSSCTKVITTLSAKIAPITVTATPISSSSISTISSSTTPPSAISSKTVPSSLVPSTPSASPSASSNTSTAAIKFYKPSQYFLEDCCEKLRLNYNNDAYKFWSTIAIGRISPLSKPEQVYTTNEDKYPGFNCFSLYLTGGEDKAAYIRQQVIEHLYFENSKSLTPVDREVEGKILFSQTATESHFQAISKWFECRIGIFNDGGWKKYGNWAATKADIPILLMEEKDGKYFPILSLK